MKVTMTVLLWVGVARTSVADISGGKANPGESLKGTLRGEV